MHGLRRLIFPVAVEAVEGRISAHREGHGLHDQRGGQQPAQFQQPIDSRSSLENSCCATDLVHTPRMSFTDRWQRTRKHLASFGVAPALFALALALFLAASISLGLNLLRVRASFDWVKHTDEVLREAADLEGDLLGAESAERGFLLTGDPSYRESFERATESGGDESATPTLVFTQPRPKSDICPTEPRRLQGAKADDVRTRSQANH
jgi:hypothetical protein